MSLQNTNLIIQASQLPATFKGKPNDLFRAMVERMRIVSSSGTGFFVISDTEPPNNQGPWLKGGTQWWVFDPDLKRYVPLDISESETRWYQVGNSIPTTTSPPLWLKTTATVPPSSTVAEPTPGTPIAWYLFDGSNWIQLPVLIDDRSITAAKLNPTANFYGTASGTNNYTLVFTPDTPFNYGNGSTEAFVGYVKFTNANTGVSTLSLNGGGGVTIKKAVNMDLVAGEIKAGSVHLLVYDGQFFQILSELPSTEIDPGPVGGIGNSEGLLITNDLVTPDDILVITANSVLLEDSMGDDLRINTVNLDLNLTLSGLGGLDTGSSTANTWYYIWLVSDGTTINAVFSLSDSNPTRPAAYRFIGLFGAVFSDSSNDLTKMWQTARKTYLIVSPIVKGPDGFQDFSTVVPPIAITVFGSTTPIGGPNAVADLVMSGDANLVGGFTFHLQDVAGNTTAVGGFFEVPMITPQNVYATSTGTLGVSFDISGFTI